MQGHHRRENGVPFVEQVIAEEDGERLASDEVFGHADRMAEALWLILHDVREGTEGGDPLTAARSLFVTVPGQRGLKGRVRREVRGDGLLSNGGDERNLRETPGDGLLDDVLNRRAIDNGDQFLRYRLRRGKESRSSARRRNHGLPERRHVPSLTARIDSGDPLAPGVNG